MRGATELNLKLAQGLHTHTRSLYAPRPPSPHPRTRCEHGFGRKKVRACPYSRPVASLCSHTAVRRSDWRQERPSNAPQLAVVARTPTLTSGDPAPHPVELPVGDLEVCWCKGSCHVSGLWSLLCVRRATGDHPRRMLGDRGGRGLNSSAGRYIQEVVAHDLYLGLRPRRAAATRALWTCQSIARKGACMLGAAQAAGQNLGPHGGAGRCCSWERLANRGKAVLGHCASAGHIIIIPGCTSGRRVAVVMAGKAPALWVKGCRQVVGVGKSFPGYFLATWCVACPRASCALEQASVHVVKCKCSGV